MQIIRDDFKKNGTLHHAYLLVGRASEILPVLHDIFQKDMNFPTEGNPDLWHQVYDSFGIDESRDLKEVQMRKPVSHDKHIFIIEAGSLTAPAQNALLKALEDPAPHAHFFFITPSMDTLLPTLLSRLSVVNILSDSKNTKTEIDTLAEDFVKSAPVKRISLCKHLQDKDKDGKQDKQQAQLFLSAVENIFHEKSRKGSGALENSPALEEIVFSKKYLSSAGTSIKMAVEHLALVLPVLK